MASVLVVAILTASIAVTLATLPSRPRHLVWGRPVAVRIPSTLGSDDEILINAISCTTPIACSAGGFISTTKTTEAFVIDETNGRWQKAQIISGTRSSGAVGDVQINALSCASPGNCSAGGSFVDVRGLSHFERIDNDAPSSAFVVDEVRGVWQAAHPVTGVVAPGNEEGAAITYVSCASAGNCAAAGRFASVPCADGDNTCLMPGATYKEQFDKSFVVSEVNGVWGMPVWLGGANRGEFLILSGLSCGAPGSCTAVGSSESPSGEQEGFVVSEADGRWSSGAAFPGSTLAGQTSSTLDAVSCVSNGNCSAGGSYTDIKGVTQPYLVDERSGSWSRPFTVADPTSSALKKYSMIQSISCGVVGECTAFGEALGPPRRGLDFFVLSEREGTWGHVRMVPGLTSASFQGFSGSAMACSVSQSCTIAGSYFSGTSLTNPYAVSETIGHFTHLVSLRGVPRLNLAPTAGDVVALSCGASDDCVVAEFFESFDYDNSFLIQESLR